MREKKSPSVLVEVVVVVALMGFLAAFPALHSRSDEAVLDAVARVLVDDVRRARALARERRERIGIAFDCARDRYCFARGDGTPLATPAPRNLAPGTVVAARFASFERMIFAADGAPETSGWVDLQRGRAARRVWFQWDTTGILIAVPGRGDLTPRGR